MAIKNTKKTKKTNVDKSVSTFTVVESDSHNKSDKYNVSLKGPVFLTASKILAFFNDFTDVSAEFDEENSVVYLYSTNHDKSDALNRFIVHKHEFGEQHLDVKVVDVVGGTATVLDQPLWEITDEAMTKAFKLIFKNSPFVPNFTKAVDQSGAVWLFFEFPDYAVSYQADSLLNIHGYDAMLIADMVKELFTFSGGYKISTFAYVED